MIKKNKILPFLAIGFSMVLAAACQNEEDAATEIASCTTNAPADSSAGIELCTVTGGPRHIKVTGVNTTATPFRSMQLQFGFETFQAGSMGQITTTTTAGRFLWYSGSGSGAQMQVEFNEVGVDSTANTGFTTADQTVCMDILDGPSIRYWVNGVNGVDCDNVATLTTANAVHTFSGFTGAASTPNLSGKHWFQANANLTNTNTIVVKNTNQGR